MRGFYPNSPIFLHRYICHICDISQLCPRNLQVVGSNTVMKFVRYGLPTINVFQVSGLFQRLKFLDAIASLEKAFDINSLIHGFSNRPICPVYSAQQSLYLIQHHPSNHLHIPIHPFIKRCVAMCTVPPILLIIIHPFIYAWPSIHLFQELP